MASMTDLVSEGLKYPFNDPKRLVSFGVLFALLSLISLGITEKSVDIVRVFGNTSGNSFILKISQLPATDTYVFALLGVLSFIIILLIMGYLYSVIKFSIEEKDELPGFDDVLRLLIDGAKYFIVALAYNIIPVIVFLVGMYTVGLYYNGDYLIVILTSILFIICNFLLIMALANMIATDKLSDAFAFKDIIGKISDLGWVKYIGIIIFILIVYMIITVALGLVMTLLTAALAIAVNNAMIVSAIIAIIEGLFISPYLSVFFSRAIGSIYNEAGSPE